MRHPNRDHEHLDVLRAYHTRYHHIPALQRIADLLGFASRAASFKLMDRLALHGYVTRAPDDDAWIPGKRFFELHLADAAVPAGTPVSVTDVQTQPFFFNDFLVKNPAATAVIPVKGDSMIDAGIYDGDLAVIERQSSARAGKFVVAQVDGEFTLKELVKVDGAFALKPHNTRYALIHPKGKLQIFGVLVGIVRRYGA